MYKPKNSSGLKNLKHLRTNVNELVISNSYAELTGTEISYTPDSNATHVVYEYRVMAHNDPDVNNTNAFVELQENISGTWTSLFENGTVGYQVYEMHTYARYQNIWQGRFVMPAYTGSKSFRLGCYTASSTECTVHSTEDSHVVHPQVTMFSIIS